MNKLNLEKRVLILKLLVKGMSIADTADVVGVSPNTVAKLLEDVGAECSVYLHFNMVKLPCIRIQVDELWSFVKMKEKRVLFYPKPVGLGDVYTWVALCPDTKLVPCYHVGRRDAEHAHQFMDDLAWRFKERIQLTSDGHQPYLEAVETAFGGAVDYAMMIKHYGGYRVLRDGRRKKCRPSECSGTSKRVICGNPDPAHISTSLVERQNRTMRMGMRRFTRETDAFSKKFQNHKAAVALHFMHYNFVRQHKSLHGATPAMAAGLAKSFWKFEDIVRLVD